MSGARPDSPHSLAEIVGGLATDIQDLVRGEIALARAEVDQKVERLTGAAVPLFGGALLALAGLVVFVQGIAAALALVLPAWAAGLIIGIVVVIIGALMARSGIAVLSNTSLTPDRTAASLQKDARVVKEHT